MFKNETIILEINNRNVKYDTLKNQYTNYLRCILCKPSFIWV